MEQGEDLPTDPIEPPPADPVPSDDETPPLSPILHTTIDSLLAWATSTLLNLKASLFFLLSYVGFLNPDSLTAFRDQERTAGESANSGSWLDRISWYQILSSTSKPPSPACTGEPSTHSGEAFTTHLGGPTSSSDGLSFQFWGPSAHFGGPSIHSGGPPDHSGGPFAHSGRYFTYPEGPSDHSGVPPDHSGGPPYHSGGPPYHSGGPPYSGGPSDHSSGPFAHSGRYFTYSEEPSDHSGRPSGDLSNEDASFARDFISRTDDLLRQIDDYCIHYLRHNELSQEVVEKFSTLELHFFQKRRKRRINVQPYIKVLAGIEELRNLVRKIQEQQGLLCDKLHYIMRRKTRLDQFIAQGENLSYIARRDNHISYSLYWIYKTLVVVNRIMEKKRKMHQMFEIIKKKLMDQMKGF